MDYETRLGEWKFSSGMLPSRDKFPYLVSSLEYYPDYYRQIVGTLPSAGDSTGGQASLPFGFGSAHGASHGSKGGNAAQVRVM